MGNFSGWDVAIVSDPTIINATSLDISGNILRTNTTGIVFEPAHCVNTNTASGCNPSDGPGVVESAVADTKSVIGPANGLLFTITYKVVGTSYSLVSISNILDLVSNAGKTVIHTDSSGSYGTQVAPDFSVDSQYPQMTVFPGHSNTSQITVTSKIGFTGIVNFTAVSPSPNVTIVLTPNRVMVLANSQAHTTLNVTASVGTVPTSYPSFKLVGLSGTLSRSILITVKVEAEPDFSLGANPGELLTPAETPNSTTVTVKSENGFSGIVNLAVVHPPGTAASLSTFSLAIPRDGQATATLNITTQSSTVRFKDLFNVTVTYTSANTGPSLYGILTVIAEPPPPDFGVSTDSISASVTAGDSKVLTFKLASLDYFEGQIYLFASSRSGVSFSFNPNSSYVNIGQTVFATLTLVTDPSTTAGDHVVTITGVSGSTPHSVNVTLAVTSVPQSAPLRILGLPPVVYFGLVAGLIVVVAVVGLLMVRKPSSQRRTIFES